MIPKARLAIPAPRRSATLLAGCALVAIAALPSTAAAQALQGNAVPVVGDPLITTGPNYTGIFPASQQTVINWQPFDTGGSGTIDFLPAGMLVEFSDPGGSLGDFTVLNRVLPVDGAGNPTARAIALNGSVFSRIVNNPGGHIWFYSPTGVIAGPNSIFSVGSLILTTNDIQFTPDLPGFTGSIYGPGGVVQFLGPAGSTGFVTVQPGAQITAGGVGAYVALVAPRVTQGGTVTSNGQVAYLAAEQLEMTINGGLFDFALTVGTEDGNGVVHTGTTTGPASISAGDRQRISMVALAKNTALTMLLSGSVGYTPAASALNEGSSIVLAAGYATDDPAEIPGDQFGNIEIGNATFRNPLTAYATDRVAIAPAGGTAAFQATATIFAVNEIDVIAEASERIEATDLFLRAGQPGAGGAIDLQAQGSGVIEATGTLVGDASGEAATFVVSPDGLDVTGGQVSVLANTGRISAAQALFSSSATGFFGDSFGGLATAGSIDLLAQGNGTLQFGALELSSIGIGGLAAGTGGNGLGGTIALRDLGGVLDFGSVLIDARGLGGAADATGGGGVGGSVDIVIGNGAQAWDSLVVNAGATAGGRNTTVAVSGSAQAQADAIDLTVTGTGSLTVTGDVALLANSNMHHNNGAGLAGQAGGVEVLVGAGGTLAVGGRLDVQANAQFAGVLLNPASTPLQRGGSASILATGGGTITAASLSATATALGAGASNDAGEARGGTATVAARAGGTITIDNGAGTSQVLISANGFGAPGPVAADAFGGLARLEAEDGTVTVRGTALVSANGQSAPLQGIPGGEGFDATGGDAGVNLLAGGPGTERIDIANLAVQANGDARLFQVGPPPPPNGFLTQGNGGNGIGGIAGLTVNSGTLVVTGVSLESSGRGGSSAATDGADTFRSGSGQGGASLFTHNGGTSTVATLAVSSNGSGGGGGTGAAASELAALAGDGTGGSATLIVAGGTLDATGATVAALGQGGAGMNHFAAGGEATDGGIGTGGTARLQSPNDATGSLTTATLAIRSSGTGGNGGIAPDGISGTGGNGVGASASTALADGAFALGAVTIEAIGRGGNGDNAGEGSGGRALFGLADGAAGPSGARGLASLTLNGSGVGGLDTSGGTADSDAGAAGWSIAVNGPAAALGFTGSLTATSLGSRVPVGAGVAGTNNGAALAAGGDIIVNTVGPVTIDALQPLTAAARVDITGQSFGSTGQIGSDTTMSVIAPDGILATGRLVSGSTTLLRAVNGAITANLDSVGAVTALARSIAIVSPGALTFADLDATAGALSVETAGNLTVATADATGAVTLRSTGGALSSTGAVNGASIALAANEGVQADANLNATGALAVDAGGTFTLAATGSGTTITVNSADIALGIAAALGVRGTTTALTLTNRDPSRAMFIGGAANPAGYSLDQAEAGQLFADNSIILGVALAGPPPPAGQGTVVVDDLAMGFGANRNLAAGGELEISTPGRVSIIGDVALTTSGATDTFTIDPTLIELDTSTGSIAMLDGAGAALGRLAMVGGTISIATTNALVQLANLTDFAAINALLDTPGGVVQPLRAGTIDLSVTNGLFIQNTGTSGAFADRRGFLSGALNITTASATTRIAINGQIVTAGGPAGGLDTVALVRINGAAPAAGGQFNAGSTVNGCVIGNNCAFVPPPPGPVPEEPGGPVAPTSDDIESPIRPGDSGGSLFIAPLIELVATDPLIAPPLVDEPITGVGNDDLWQADCDNPEAGNCEAND